MHSIDFLKDFWGIEDRLYLLIPDFDKRSGFINLVKNIKKRKLISESILKDILIFFEFANKFFSEVEGVAIDKLIEDKLRFLKQNLN